MSYSETSYQNWIQAQLEPDGIILVGRMKREPEVKKEWLQSIPELEVIKDIAWEIEDNRKQDEYLKRHGIY